MKKNRYLYAVVGVAVMLFAGFVYAWSILSAPIAADFPQWTNAQLSLTFTICMAFFCLGGMAAGMLSKRIPIRVNVIISALLFLVGFFLTARANSLPMLYICYGVLCGTASGFSYNSVMSTMPRWFPDRQGLISGILLMGFGASSMIIGTLFARLTPAATGAWRGSLSFMGVLMAVIILLASFFFAPPQDDGQSAAAQAPSSDPQGLELTPGQMLARPSFWLFFLWATLMAAAGLVIIAQARTVAHTAAPAMDAGTLSFVVGLISVCNGLGRVLFGGLFDRIGRKYTMLLIVLSSVLGTCCLWAAMSGSTALLVAGFIFTGLGYGGPPTMSAAVTKQFYGQKNYPVNFSLMNINLLVASFASTAAGAILDTTNSFTAIFLILFAFAVTAFASALALRRP